MKTIRVRVCAFIRDRKNRLLMVKHRKAGREYWLLPGGGIEFGETFAQALKRELLEELNVGISPSDFMFIAENIARDMSRHTLHICFSADIVSGELSVGTDARVVDFRYLSHADLAGAEVHPAIRKELIEYLRCKNYNNRLIQPEWIR